MLDALSGLFDMAAFSPRKNGGPGWTVALLWLHITSDLFIWLAFVSLPIVLLAFARRRGQARPRRVGLFAAAFVLCGLTFLVDALSFDYPVARFLGLLKVLLALALWAAVIAVVPFVSRLFPEAVGLAGTAAADTKLHRPLPPDSTDRSYGYLGAAIAGVLALLLRGAVDKFLYEDNAFVIALLAVVIVSWRYGFGPGVLTTVIGVGGYSFFFLPPRGSIFVAGVSNQMAAALFFFCGVACAALGESQRTANRRAVQALTETMSREQDLESEVARRRVVEAALRQREVDLVAAQWQSAEALAGLNAFLDNAPLGIAFFDPELRFVRVNPYLAKVNGKPIEAHLGKLLKDVVPDVPADIQDAYRRTAGPQGEPFTVQIRRDNPESPGDERVWQIIAFPVRGAGLHNFGAGLVVQDVTDRLRAEEDQKRQSEVLERTVHLRTADLLDEVEERKSAEAEVRKQQEYLNAILENVADGIVACDESGKITLLNRAAHEFYGNGSSTLTPEAWAERADLFRPDGKTRLPPEEVPLMRALNGERVRDVELVIAPPGASLRFVLASGQRLTDMDGRHLGAVISLHDVTEQRMADRAIREASEELRRTNAELQRSNGELEKFAYVASHDLQEPLRKIQTFGDRLRDRCREQLPEFGQEYVDRMLTAAGRMRRLIDDLLRFSRVTTQKRPYELVCLEKLAAEVVSEDLDESLAAAGAVVCIGTLPTLEADPSQIRQLFQNLIGNAVKFRRPGVAPLVEITGEIVRKPADVALGAPPGSWAKIVVRDNGIGFDDKYQDRIFEVFQRLFGRDEYEGTGVGLAICRKIVERHGGSISAQGRVGNGAAFTILIPIQQTHATPESPVSNE